MTSTRLLNVEEEQKIMSLANDQATSKLAAAKVEIERMRANTDAKRADSNT